MITREIIATDDPAAASLLPFARKEFAELRERRLAHKLPLLKRNFHINGLTVLLYCGRHLERITILGSYTYHMLFSSPDSITRISTYNYLSDVLRAAVTVPANAADPIHAFANTHCHLGDTQDVFLAGGWKTAALVGATNYEHIATSPQYEVELLGRSNAFMLRTFEGIAPVAVSVDPVLPIYGNYLNLFGVTHYPQTPNWNLWRGASLSYISPANANVGESWVWVPSFFIVDPGDAFFLKPGWYYGIYPTPDYSFDDALESAKVSLVGMIETKNNSTPRKTGWVECVTETNGESRGDINFFFVDNLPSAGSGTAYREIALTLRDLATMTIGAALQGFAKTFSVPTLVPGMKPDEVVAWNFSAWTDSDALVPSDPSAFCALIIEGKSCRAYRWRGYQSNFFNTENYHSYSVNADGTMLAIFEGSSIIENVSVFDLFGTRAGKDEPATYVSGALTEIQLRSDVVQLNAMSGCFIPFRVEDFTQSVPLFTLDSVEVKKIEALNRDYLSSFSTLVFTKNGASPLVISKLTCENGVDAEYGISVDECFSSIIHIDDPDTVSASDKLVSVWDAGGIFRGKVRGDFSGSHPDMRFDGITDGDPLQTVTLPGTLTVGQYEDGTFYVSGVVGDLTVGGCLTPDMRESDECRDAFDCKGGEKVFSAATSCGQTGEYVIEVAPPEPLTIYAGETLNDALSASGGVPPYAWSMSCGAIDRDTGEVLDTTGCCGAVTVTVTDSCGESASIDVRGPRGSWNVVSMTRVSGDDDLFGCVNWNYDTDYECWQGGCDISQCGCGTCYYYYGATSRARSCSVPGFNPTGVQVDDCSFTYCYKVVEAFQCEYAAHIKDC